MLCNIQPILIFVTILEQAVLHFGLFSSGKPYPPMLPGPTYSSVANAPEEHKGPVEV